jgi:hypothetical protein
MSATVNSIGNSRIERTQLSRCPGLSQLPPKLQEAYINGHGNEPQIRKIVSENYRKKVQGASTPSSPTSPKR